jgi:hypothetical protein
MQFSINDARADDPYETFGHFDPFEARQLLGLARI